MLHLRWPGIGSLIALTVLMLLAGLPAAMPVQAGGPGSVATYQVFLPAASNHTPVPTPTSTPTATPTPTARPTATAQPTFTPTPTATSAPAIDWDPRLTQRFAKLIPAAVSPGQGYWKLVKAVWYDTNDLRPMGVGDHDIAVDVCNDDNVRQVGKTMQISWGDDGSCPSALMAEFANVRATDFDGPRRVTTLCINTIKTEQKAGEPYAGSYPMYHTAPTYRIEVEDGQPSDAVDGLGMGSIADPYHKVHTSYGFYWRWTVALAGNPSPTPTATPTATDSDTTPDPTGPTGTPTRTVAPTATPTCTVEASPTSTPTGSVTPVPPADRIWDPRLTQRGAVLATAQVQPGQGYWRLVSAKWYDVTEQPFDHRGLILVDTRDQNGNRQPGNRVQIADLNGGSLGIVTTETKPGELYAANFAIYEPAPAYMGQVLGAPSDSVSRMGLGTLTNPGSRDPTRYGLTWQWTIAPAAGGDTAGAMFLPGLLSKAGEVNR